MKCDELKAFVARKIDEGTCDPVPCVEVYLKDEVDAVIAEKDMALEYAKALTLKDIETIKEKDKEIAELKEQLESEKASRYAESVDAGMRERRLKRALWLARAERAKDKQLLFHFSTGYPKLRVDGFYDPYSGRKELSPKKWIKVFNKVENKCRAMAEKFKDGV